MPSVKGPLKEFGKLLTTKVVALAVAEDDSRIVGIVHDLVVRGAKTRFKPSNCVRCSSSI